MDIESHESAMLLKEGSPRRRQGLALKLAFVLGVPVIVPARGAKWAFSEIYGRLAALQASGAAPIIEAWLAGELPLTSFP